MSLGWKTFVNADDRNKVMQNEPGSAWRMEQQLCIGSAMKGIDSTKQKVLPCTAAVRLPQLSRKYFFQMFYLCMKLIFIFIHIYRGKTR